MALGSNETDKKGLMSLYSPAPGSLAIPSVIPKHGVMKREDITEDGDDAEGPWLSLPGRIVLPASQERKIHTRLQNLSHIEYKPLQRQEPPSSIAQTWGLEWKPSNKQASKQTNPALILASYRESSKITPLGAHLYLDTCFN